MTDNRLAAYARLREAVLTTSDPVRALCAKEGVSWQAFYKHARHRGWSLRQTGRRRPEPRDPAGKLRAIVGSYCEALEDKGPNQPKTNLAAARLAAMCAATLARLATIERKERGASPGRRQRRVMTDARRMQLAWKLHALCDDAKAEDERRADEKVASDCELPGVFTR